MPFPNDPLSPLEGISNLPYYDIPAISEAPVASCSPKKRAGEATDAVQSPNKRSRLSTTEHLSSSPASRPASLTPKQQERRDKLLRDQHVHVLSPYLVQCKRCATRIKLAGNDAYDPHHWTTHRGRCDKWSDAKVAEKRASAAALNAEFSTDASRLSTPSLTADNGSEGPITRAQSESSSEVQSSLPHLYVDPEKMCPNQPARSLTSHLKCAKYLALGYHPGAECMDLDVPLPEIPKWRYNDLKLPVFVQGEEVAVEDPLELRLQHALWPESERDTGFSPPQYSFPMPPPRVEALP